MASVLKQDPNTRKRFKKKIIKELFIRTKQSYNEEEKYKAVYMVKFKITFF